MLWSYSFTCLTLMRKDVKCAKRSQELPAISRPQGGPGPCNIVGPSEGSTDFRASSQKIRLSGPPKEKRMTDGTARPVDRESHELANFSAYSSHKGDKERGGPEEEEEG